jgi:hypothetical protein
MTLKFLAVQGAPYIYDISRLRVNSPVYFSVIKSLIFCYNGKNRKQIRDAELMILVFMYDDRNAINLTLSAIRLAERKRTGLREFGG